MKHNVGKHLESQSLHCHTIRNVAYQSYFGQKGNCPYGYLILICLLTVFLGSGQLLWSGNGFKVDKSTTQHLSLSYTVEKWHHETMETPMGRFEKLIVPGYLWQTEVGKPALPMLRRIITVPEGAEPLLRASSAGSILIDMKQFGMNHQIIPSQPEYAKNDTKESMIFHIDKSYYSNPTQDNDFSRYQQNPENMFRITDLGYLRNYRLFAVDFLPFVYNPIQNQLLLSREVNLEISFVGVNAAAQEELDNRYFSPAYESVFNSFVINYNESRPRNNLLRVPMTYLILCPPIFTSAIQPFAEWKRREGYKVTIKTVGSGADIENNNTAIKSWMQQSWDNATQENPAFSFVLIVGDTPQVTWSATYEYRNSGVWYQTDRNYFLLQGGDSIPEMYWGRFSATSVAQLQTIVNKTIQYQQMSMQDNSYLARAALIAGPDYDQGIPQNTPVTNNQVLYATSYFNPDNGFDTMAWYSPASHNAASAIVSRINQGNALVSYTGHGLESRWDGPVISSTGTNLNMCGIVIGNACLTSTINSTTSYGENWLRNGTGGAVAYVGASCYSIWTPDFYWSVGTHGMTYSPGGDGVYDALFHNQGQPYQQWAGSVGAMVFIGNMAVMAGDSSWSSYYWAIYNIMGDPSTIPYMGIPQNCPAVIPDYLINGVDQYLNITGASPGTLVSLHSEGDPVSGITDATGSIQLNLSAFSEPAVLFLTLSAQNFQPLLTQVNLLAPTANPVLVDYCKNSSSDRTVTPGESFSINLSIHNLGAQATGSMALQLNSQDPYLQINQGTASSNSLEINQSVDLSALFNLQVLPHVPNNHQIQMILTLGSRQQYALNFTVSRPPSQPWVAVEEDFESGQSHGNPVNGWSQVQISGGNPWLADGSAGYQGGTCASLQGIASAWIYKPVELIAGRPYKLRFRYRTTTATSTNYRIHFAASTDPPTSATTWGTELYNNNLAATSWQLYNGIGTYTPTSSGIHYFGFRGNLINFSSNYIYVDDVYFLYEEDLSVQSISVSPEDVIAGETLTVSANIRNNSIPVTNKEVSLWINGSLTDTFNIASLATNASVNVSFSFPSPAGQNSYQVSVPLDSNTANNQQSASYYSFPASYAVQSFEENLLPPVGWSFQTPWSVKNTSVNRYHGNNYAVMDNGGAAHTDKRISAAILFRQPEDRFRFYYKTYGSPNSRLQYSYNGSTWITIRQLSNTSQVWTRHELAGSELPAPHTGIIYFSICSTTGSGYHYTFVDKFIFEAANISDPVLQIDPVSLDFGNVPLGTSTQLQSITIKNTGGGTLGISSISLESQYLGFEMIPTELPTALYSLDELEIQLSFNAQVQGATSTNLNVQTSLGIHTVSLTAYGWQEPTLSCWSSEILFPDTPVGSYTELEVMFYNSGNGILTLYAGDITIPEDYGLRNPQVFQIVDNNSYPLNLEHLQQASITITFNPQQAISYSEGLVFASEGITLLTIPIYGLGITSGLDTPIAFISMDEGLIYLKWYPVNAATTYVIEHSQEPDSGFSPILQPDFFYEAGVYNLMLLNNIRGFYRVIAIQ